MDFWSFPAVNIGFLVISCSKYWGFGHFNAGNLAFLVILIQQILDFWSVPAVNWHFGSFSGRKHKLFWGVLWHSFNLSNVISSSLRWILDSHNPFFKMKILWIQFQSYQLLFQPIFLLRRLASIWVISWRVAKTRWEDWTWLKSHSPFWNNGLTCRSYQNLSKFLKKWKNSRIFSSLVLF